MTTKTLNISLPSSTLYVSGKVNGLNYTWTNIDANMWQAIVNRAEDDVYYVELTIINNSGNSYEQSFTLYYGLHLITDRTQSDVDLVKELRSKSWNNLTENEKLQFLSNLKGSYNASDLNRVGAAVKYLHDKLSSLGYIIDVTVKQDWGMSDIPNQEKMIIYLQNVDNLKKSFVVNLDVPYLPESMDFLDYEKANNIEKILEDIDKNITNMELSWLYSGEIFAGEDVI